MTKKGWEPEQREPEKDQERIAPEPPISPEELKGKGYGWILLHYRGIIFDKVAENQDLNPMIFYFLRHAAIYAAIFGFTLGFYAKNLQLLLAALKAPVLIIGTMGICLPALYTFNVLMGSRLSFKQAAAMLSLTTYVMATVLVSVAPIMAFFILTTTGKPFVLLLNVAFFAAAGLFGLRFLWAGMGSQTLHAGYRPNLWIIRVWTLIYMFVGTQFAWLLRPFFGNPGETVLFRNLEGNFYQSVFRSIVAWVAG